MHHYSRETSQIEARLGERFEVRLPSSPGAGYVWNVRVPPVVVRLANQSVHPGAGIGAAAHEVFVFEATGEGNTVLEFAYGRPWESSPKETLQLPVQVAAKQG
jgi:predicted secreted protein